MWGLMRLFRNLILRWMLFLISGPIITQDYMMVSTYGIEPPYCNIGKVTNKGFEANWYIVTIFVNLIII